MGKTPPPPPTRYGAAGAVQPKTAGTVGRMALPPPPTRFGAVAPVAAQPAMVRPSAAYAATARPTVVQRMEFNFTTEPSGKIFNVDAKGRTDTVVGKGIQGQHTTATLMHNHLFTNVMIGKDIPNANKALVDMMEELKKLPTYDPTPLVLKNSTMPYKTVSTIDELGDNLERAILFRNSFKMAAFKTSKKPKGGKVSKHSGVNEGILVALQDIEHKLLRGIPLNKQQATYQADNIMHTIWDGWHFNPAGLRSETEVAQSIATHAYEAELAYPKICKNYLIDRHEIAKYLMKLNGARYKDRMKNSTNSSDYLDNSFITAVSKKVKDIL